jgi:hypothetical protein
MIRYVFIAAMLAILCIVLYIPSAVPPERFLDVLRQEHAVMQRTWGPEVADRVLARMLDMQRASAVSAPPTPVETKQPTAVDAAMTAQIGQMSTRLFGNPYFRSIDSLFALVTYRLLATLELLPLLGIFLVIVAVDGFVVRMVRSKEFIPHSAEMFGGSVVGGIALGSAVVVAWFLPYQLHPMLVVLALLAMLFVLSRAVANYHVMR